MSEKVAASKSPRSVLTKAAIVLVVSAVVFFVARVAWEDWTLYAIAFSAFMLLGGVRFWPWSLRSVRPVGIGLILGLLFAAAEFYIYKVVQ